MIKNYKGFRIGWIAGPPDEVYLMDPATAEVIGSKITNKAICEQNKKALVQELELILDKLFT